MSLWNMLCAKQKCYFEGEHKSSLSKEIALFHLRSRSVSERRERAGLGGLNELSSSDPLAFWEEARQKASGSPCVSLITGPWVIPALRFLWGQARRVKTAASLFTTSNLVQILAPAVGSHEPGTQILNLWSSWKVGEWGLFKNKIINDLL